MTLSLAWALLPGLLACGDKDGDTGEPVVANITLTDANNFSYVGDINVQSFVTASASDSRACSQRIAPAQPIKGTAHKRPIHTYCRSVPSRSR